ARQPDFAEVGRAASRQEGCRPARSRWCERSGGRGRRRSDRGVTDMAKIKIKQIGSPIRRPEAQKKILTGLGLGKMNKVVELEDTPEVRGAIAKLPHMVAVVD